MLASPGRQDRPLWMSCLAGRLTVPSVNLNGYLVLGATMLAGIRDYTHGWQLLIGLAYLVAWLVAGSILMQRALRRIAKLPGSKTSPGRCFTLNALAGGLGLAAAMAIVGLFLVAALRTERRAWALPGVVLAMVAMPVMFWAVLLNLLRLPGRTVWRITAATAGPILGMLVLAGLGAALPAWYMRQPELKRLACVRRLRKIERALLQYAVRNVGTEAPSLRSLLAMRSPGSAAIHPDDLACPAAAQGGEYLYVPRASREPSPDRIWVCDRHPYHRGQRVVLLADGRIIACDERTFRLLLARPENAELREVAGLRP